MRLWDADDEDDQVDTGVVSDSDHWLDRGSEPLPWDNEQPKPPRKSRSWTPVIILLSLLIAGMTAGSVALTVTPAEQPTQTTTAYVTVTPTPSEAPTMPTPTMSPTPEAPETSIAPEPDPESETVPQPAPEPAPAPPPPTKAPVPVAQPVPATQPDSAAQVPASSPPSISGMSCSRAPNGVVSASVSLSTGGTAGTLTIVIGGFQQSIPIPANGKSGAADAGGFASSTTCVATVSTGGGTVTRSATSD